MQTRHNSPKMPLKQKAIESKHKMAQNHPTSSSWDGCFARVTFQAFPFNLCHPCLTPSFASTSAPLAINSAAVAVYPFQHAQISAVQFF
jgi:hypothetical protein